MNKVILMGRLTKDPDVYCSKSETAKNVVRYTLAVRRGYVKAGERDADFIDIVAFGRQGEFAEKYFRKGKQIILSGTLHQDVWEDADQLKHSKWEVIAEDQHFAEPKSNTHEEAFHAADGQIAITQEDLPY